MSIPTLREVAETKRARPSRILSAIAPGFVARREESKLRLRRAETEIALLDEFGQIAFRAGYQGASKESGYSLWNPGGGSPDEDVLEDLPLLRERTRDLVRSDPHASGLVDTWVSNIVGTGLVPQSRIDRESIGLTEAQADEFQRGAEKVYRRWSRKVDVAGLLTAGELQELILRQIFENGDVFAIPRPVTGRRYSLACQLVEADRVTTPTNKSSDNSIREGVILGPNGEHVAFMVKRTHPGDTQIQRQDDFVRVESLSKSGREQIFHLYRILRPDQSRGVPFLAPALLLFKDLQTYFRAELLAAKVAACYALFIVTPDPVGAVTAATNAARSAGLATNQATGRLKTEAIQPGMVRYLQPGEDVKDFNPNRPNSQFNEFVMRMLRAIGTTVSTPYELVSQDFSQTTYTSGRMALTEVRRVYRKYQRWLVDKFLHPMWERLLEEAILMGEIAAPRFDEFRDEYTQAQWIGPSWQWVDPEKEVNATNLAITGNLTTLADECAGQGKDWEDVLRQRAREKSRADKLGLTPAPLPGQQPAPAGAPDQAEPQGDEPEEDADE